jgi:hypothetical protein
VVFVTKKEFEKLEQVVKQQGQLIHNLIYELDKKAEEEKQEPTYFG